MTIDNALLGGRKLEIAVWGVIYLTSMGCIANRNQGKELRYSAHTITVR